MAMYCKPLKNIEKISRALREDELLFFQAMPDSELLENREVWEVDKNSLYLGTYTDEGKLVCITKYEPATDIAAIVHHYVFSRYWGTGTSDEMECTVCRWFLDNTNFKKTLVFTPSECENVLKAAVRAGYQIEGASPGATLWRGKICALVMLGKFLGENNG